jgi:inorganic pyrophosphatase
MVLGETFVLWFVPAAAVVGILFALTQWFIVSRVSVGGEGKGNNGYLHVEEDGISELEVVAKCAEIQAAISEGLCVSAAIEISSTHSLSSIGFLVESLLSCLPEKCVFFLFRDAFFPEEKDDDERL